MRLWLGKGSQIRSLGRILKKKESSLRERERGRERRMVERTLADNIREVAEERNLRTSLGSGLRSRRRTSRDWLQMRQEADCNGD